jgi:hypothetical protein
MTTFAGGVETTSNVAMLPLGAAGVDERFDAADFDEELLTGVFFTATAELPGDKLTSSVRFGESLNTTSSEKSA